MAPFNRRTQETVFSRFWPFSQPLRRFKNCDCRFFLLVSFCLLWHAAEAPAVQSLEKLEIKQSDLGELSGDMKNLIRLDWEGRSIRLNRKFDTPDQPTVEEIAKQYMEKGLGEGAAMRFAEQKVRMRGQGDSINNVFKDCVSRHGTGFGRMSSGDSTTTNFRGKKLTGSCVTSGETIQIKFHESRGEQQFNFKSIQPGQLSILFVGESAVVEFRQALDGAVRLGVLADDAHIFKAKDYRTLTERHPDAVEKILLPLFDYIGVKGPITIHSPEVLTAIITKIAAAEASTEERAATAQHLVEQLDSINRGAKTRAFARLCEGYQYWKEFLPTYQDDENVSPDAKKQLKQLEAAVANHQPTSFIKSENLLESPSFFIDWLARSPDEKQLKVILPHLQKITSQDFGNDASQWQAWLDSNQ